LGREARHRIADLADSAAYAMIPVASGQLQRDEPGSFEVAWVSKLG